MEIEEKQNYLLTQYSHGAGCGCKISPKLLDSILKISHEINPFPQLIVGNESKDDAAVFDIGNGLCIVSTTDFFMPIVDDAKDFGKIASVNAISDIYAMGGKPIMAIAILGWPIQKLPVSLANLVIEGSREVCREAGIPLAGGHSIDCPEPLFGLAVTGLVQKSELKKNGGDINDCELFLTKPLGVGILTTALKQTKLLEKHRELAKDSMIVLNKLGEEFGKLDYIKAMTDVTGFGLLGHLIEMCEASACSAIIHWDKIPYLDQEAIQYYTELGCVPGGTNRNWESYGHKVKLKTPDQKFILADPQTSGGLLVAVPRKNLNDFQKFLSSRNLKLETIGFTQMKSEFVVYLD